MSMVTIFADASVNPKMKIAGIGAWAKGDGRKSVTYNSAIEFHTGVTLAELQALQMVVAHLISEKYFEDTDDTVMLQSDCLQALWIISKTIPNSWESKHDGGASIANWNQKSKPSGRQRQEAQRIADLLDGKQVILRHVRGHKEGGGRQWVNDICDKMAKRAAYSGKNLSKSPP